MHEEIRRNKGKRKETVALNDKVRMGPVLTMGAG